MPSTPAMHCNPNCSTDHLALWRVSDVLKYRVDPLTTFTNVLMRADGADGDQVPGDGLFSAVLPGRPTGRMVAFHIEAADNAAVPLTSRFPSDAPFRECLIRFGDPTPAGSFGVYRLWISQSNLHAWAARSRVDSTPKDLTFVHPQSGALWGCQHQKACICRAWNQKSGGWQIPNETWRFCQTPEIGPSSPPAMSAGLRQWQFCFQDGGLTHFGGLGLVQRFGHRLRLRWRLQKYVPIPRRQGEDWPADLILALLYAIIAGLRRINKTQVLQYNGAFGSLLGLEQFPDQTTLRRFLKRLPPPSIRQLVRLHDRLRAGLWTRPRARTSLVWDLDSVVLTVYGQQQGARVGYNPKEKGRRSYHPLLCFEAHQQEFWHGSLRPGNAAANTGVVPFLQRCLNKVPPGIAQSRLRLRADSGFFSGRLVGFLDALGCG